MAESEDSRDQRQLPASERKLSKAREDGRTARSREVAHAAALVAAIGAALLYGPYFADRTLAMIRGTLRFDRAASRDAPRALEAFSGAAFEALAATLPLLAVPLAAATVASLAVGGLVLSFKPIEFDLSRADPMAGLKRVFSINALIDLGKLSLIATAVGITGFFFASAQLPAIAALGSLPAAAALSEAASHLRWGAVWVALVIIVAALFDAPLQIYRFRKQLRMTPQEVKREHREVEGDPRLRAKLRERQRAISRGRMLEAVPAADIVVTNPTHYAVALKYDESAMGAPRVVAKGADLLAARIRELAIEHDVPLLEAPPLARALYAHVEIDQEIPAPLYAAVAQVLAYVYQLNEHRRGRRPRPAAPGVDVPPELDPQRGDADGGGRP